MAGTPTIITRASLGPDMIDERITVDPQREVSAKRMNLQSWQLSGVGRVAPQIIIQHGDTVNVTYAAATWDNIRYIGSTIASIPWINSVSKNANGDFNYFFASTAEDEEGSLISLDFQAAQVFPQDLDIDSANKLIGEAVRISGTAWRARTRPITNLGQDNDFLFLLW